MKRSIEKEFIVINPDKKAFVENFDAKLYQRLNLDYEGFKGHQLISCHEFSEDWSSWEIHPHGDEVVLLLSGKVTLILQLEEGIQEVALEREGTYVIVPQNTCHTAKTHVKTRMLFITAGEATQHKDV